MAKWQVIDGNWYVAKHGYDTILSWNTALGTSEVNADNIGSKNYPFRTLDILQTTSEPTNIPMPGDKVVIGSGRWGEDAYLATSSKIFKYFGDGEVIFSTIDYKYHYIYPPANTHYYYHDIIFDYSGVALFYNANWTGIVYELTNCILLNVTFSGGKYTEGVGIKAENTLFKNCYFNNTGAYFNMYTNNCVFDNCRTKSLAGGNAGVRPYVCINTIFVNCKYLQLTYRHSVLGYANIDYCCIVGEINYDGMIVTNEYFQNTLMINLNGIDSEPQFNSPEINDYTISKGSSCAYAGKNGANIGLKSLGYSLNPNSVQFSNGIITNLTKKAININGTDYFVYQLTSGQTIGTAETVVIDLGEVLPLDKINLFANHLFDSNGNFISLVDKLDANQTNLTGETHQLDFEMMWGEIESEMTTRGYKNFIWNAPLTIDSSDNGNAEDSFVVSEAHNINARFIKIKLTLQEV